MTSPASPLSIALRGCAKTFADGTRALEPLDLDIAPGETVVLLGPSGCGKTTTLRLIAGLERPDAGGRVLFDGADVTALPIEQRNVGMVFQSYALFPNMTVAGNIAYGLRVRKVPPRDLAARVDELLAMMRIEPLAERQIDQLSGGQRQRVALARALAVRPRALLLDEPLTALDAKLRDALRVEIDSLLRGLRITAVYVTHDQGEAMALGDRIVVMDHGRVAQVGTPREIYHRPATPFVAEFIGTMNRLAGEVRGGMLESRAGRLPWPGAAPAGGRGELLFRPEDVSVVEEPGPEGSPGALRGTVTSALFLGDRTRLFVDVGEGPPVVVESPARREFRRGEALALRIDPAGVLVLPGGRPC
jgi:putative spermidine/putrescine transport system ATP-binding protein